MMAGYAAKSYKHRCLIPGRNYDLVNGSPDEPANKEKTSLSAV
jgi:hypothetical protein